MGTTASKYPGHRGEGNGRARSTPARPRSTPPTATPTNGRLNRRNAPSSAPSSAPPQLASVPAPQQAPPQPQPQQNVQISAGPGAFIVTPGGPGSVFRVIVPDGIQPGEEFQVHAGNRIVRVQCPLDSRAGHSLQITVPSESVMTPTSSMAPITSTGTNGPLPMPEHIRINMHSPEVLSADNDAYTVTVPPGISDGQQFPVTIAGQQLMVTCPANAREGSSIRVIPPPQPTPTPPPEQIERPRPPRPQNNTTNQMFEVVVPSGARVGTPFALFAGGQRVLVTCPPNTLPGQRIRFMLPTAPIVSSDKKGSLPNVKLSYDKDGWTRTIRVTDMKFQWIRMDDKGDVELNKRFDMQKSAYVRKIDYLDGADPRMRAGLMSLVPATEAAVESCIIGANGNDLVSYADIAQAQVKEFDDKAQWFQDTCLHLCVEWNEGHMRINVRRNLLLSDSMEAIMSLSRSDLRKVWRFEFLGEPGIDAGGLAREWFQLVCEEIFNPDNGLWMSSATNQMSMMINPASELACPDDHLIYFRFLGRVMGKALFDHQLIAGHMVRHMYKHMLGWPITFEDLRLVDEEYYNNLKKIAHYTAEELEMMCLDFTLSEQSLGQILEVELVEGGASIDVTKDNLPEYLECCLKYRMLGRVKVQATELLLGFFDVIPEPLLTVFDFQELELLMCGLPNIVMEDWKFNTIYSGKFNGINGNKVCDWFWEVVEEFDREMKARLLQFVTGTSGVPSRGFSVLQGNDGSIRRFTIHGVDLATCLYPRAHTCFNRIDLPNYKTKDDLRDKLSFAVQMEATGFDIE